MNYILSKFSHELRNPLTSLFSTIQLIELQHPEVKNFKYWSNLSSDIDYINRLVNDFSDYSKIENLNLTTFSLQTVLKQLSLSFAASIACTDVMYTSQIDSSITQITGDKTKLQEVFLNLLKNAFDAATPDKSIRLKAFSSESEITILIEDTGCGMSEKQLETIFEPFVTYKEHGTGLGLFICKQIVTAHSGTISVSSSRNKGTTFSVTLPIDIHSL